MKAKDWSSGNIPNHRAYSNNSIVCNDFSEIENDKDFWDGYLGNGEPYGLINLDLSKKCGRLGETKYPDPDVVCYNPCFSGDTLIAVADGRGCVSIKQLVEENKDVPVYSMNKETKEVSIKWGRNPRVTGENMDLIRVHFDGKHKGEFVDVTPNHKFFTNDGREVEAKDLQEGDSIPKFKKCLNGKDDYIVVYNGEKRITEHRMIAEFHNPERFRENFKEGVYDGCCRTNDVVVHHKDENKTNNCVDNLEITTFSEHSYHHGKELVGDKNPMYGKKHTVESKELIGQKTRERCEDPEFIQKLRDSHTDEMKLKYSENMKKLKKGWDAENSEEVEKKCKESGLESERISDSIVKVVKYCEHCKEKFLVQWSLREQCYCSQSCGNTKPSSVVNRTLGLRKVNEEKSKENFHKQVMLYKDMQKTQKVILQKEWVEECKKKDISYRFQTNSPNPYICKNWGDFKKRADEYNHRVSHIEKLSGKHTVYNITVEDNHTLAVVTKSKNKNMNLSGVYFSNCGEQSLARAESCCLGELFLPNIKTQQEFLKCITYIYRICKHSLTLPCINSVDTQKIVRKNMRMGIGVTGYLQATEEQKNWLSDGYKYLREFDREYSIKNGFPQSIKLTTCKPSGCSRKDMLISTDQGLLRLDEIGNVKGTEWQEINNLKVYTENSKLQNVTKFYVNGKVPTKLIKTVDGVEIESSLNHKFKVIKYEDGGVVLYSWKTVESLQPGDSFAVKIGGHPEDIDTKFQNIRKSWCSMFKQPEIMTKEISWFLGIYYSHGSCDNSCIYISLKTPKNRLLQWLRHFFIDSFNLSSVIEDNELIVESKDLIKWLIKNGLTKESPEKITVPKIIRTSSKQNVESFIDGFISCDEGQNLVCNSEKFAQDILYLYRNIGETATISEIRSGGLVKNSCWKVRKTEGRNKSIIFVDGKAEAFYTDKIETVTDSTCETFDIEVENVHHYRLGGIVSHNTLSILGGCTPGIHPGFSQYYKRRVRIASGSSLIDVAKKHGYHVEYVKNFDGNLDYNTQIVTFPYKLPEGTILADNCTAIDQLEYVKRLQTEWSDNSVSVTVYYRKHELPEIKEWLKKNYNNSIKTVSFLLHSDHGFIQAPMEQITKQEYEELANKCTKIKDLQGITYMEEAYENLVSECASGACPIR